MVAQPDVEPATDAFPAPVRIISGLLGADSPAADPSMAPGRWHAWLDLVACRAAGRPVPRPALDVALDSHLEASWDLWWLTLHLAEQQWLVHRARVYGHDGGDTLVSACRLTAPWSGPSPQIMPVAEGTPPEHWARCAMCADAPAAP